MPIHVEHRAWRALRRSRRRAPQLPAEFMRLLPGDGAGGKRPLLLGMDPALAYGELVAGGLPEDEARRAVHAAIIRRFPAFANSWDGYIGNHGWLRELAGLDDAERAELEERWELGKLIEGVKLLAADPVGMLSSIPELQQTLAIAGRLASDRESPGHPAAQLLTARHGLHPELTHAVMLHQRVMPWWVVPVLLLAALVTLAVFVLALVDPQNEGFRNAGGVSWLHYTALPLFGLFFGAAAVWLVIDKPRRERAWREQLACYVEAWERER